MVHIQCKGMINHKIYFFKNINNIFILKMALVKNIFEASIIWNRLDIAGNTNIYSFSFRLRLLFRTSNYGEHS